MGESADLTSRQITWSTLAAALCTVTVVVKARVTPEYNHEYYEWWDQGSDTSGAVLYEREYCHGVRVIC